MKIIVLIFMLTIGLNAKETNRIDSISINEYQPQEIKMVYGRSTVIILPCNVVSYSDGPTRDIEAILDERNSQRMEVWFTKNSPEPQELKVFCQDKNFVFDILPNQREHRSIVEVPRSYKSRSVHFNSANGVSDSISVKRPKILKVIKSSSSNGVKL